MNNLVSIIVPIYNSSKYLKECLLSIYQQTYKNIEVILVDDGSVDGSNLICDEFCSRYKNFFVYHNSNHGVSYSRNFGINKSKGDFICFVDSDDTIDEHFVEKLLYKIEDKGIVFTRFDIIYENGFSKKYVELKLPDLIQSNFDFKYFLVNNLYKNDKDSIITDCIFGSCCRSLFRREIIVSNNIKFPNKVKLGEDKIFLMQYLLKTSKRDLVDEYLYHYRNNVNSAVKKYASNYINNFYSNRISSLKEELEVFKKIENKKHSNLLTNYAKMSFNYNFVINEIKTSENGDYKKLFEITKTEYCKFLNFSIAKCSRLNKMNFKRKILLFLIKYRKYNLIKFYIRGGKK